MTDPFNALQSFQLEFLHGRVSVRPGLLDRELYVHFDEPEGEPRVTYVRLENTTIIALVSFARSQPIDGAPCFSIGYAVSEAYRNRGHAKETITAAIAEMQHGLPFSVFYVEAIVAAGNEPSRRVAERVISDAPVAITERISGLPAFRYLRRIER